MHILLWGHRYTAMPKYENTRDYTSALSMIRFYAVLVDTDRVYPYLVGLLYWDGGKHALALPNLNKMRQSENRVYIS